MSKFTLGDKNKLRQPASDISDVTTEKTYPRHLGYIPKYRELIIHSLTNNKHDLNTFRKMRTNVFNRVEESNAILMVTSISPRGGASYVALNLALSITYDKNDIVLLIDCNISNSTLSKTLLIKDENVGLKQYLQNQKINVSDIIFPTIISGLSMIPMGPISINNEEWLARNRIDHLFYEIKSKFKQRAIIIDTPCISTNADARILSDLCDHILLVATYAKSTIYSIEKVLSEINHDKVIGIIFNNVPKTPFT